MSCGIALALPAAIKATQAPSRTSTRQVKTVSDRFNSTFFRLLLEGNGHITLVQFAKETQLSIEEARQLLDEKAKEFNATFDTDEKGDISYYFNP
jgi:large subunit ribosomal protein L7/L12